MSRHTEARKVKTDLENEIQRGDKKGTSKNLLSSCLSIYLLILEITTTPDVGELYPF